jgi:hypothetical protein
MKKSVMASRAAFIVPLVLLAVALLEDLATYEVRRTVRNVEMRVAVIVLLNGVMFTAAAEWLSPWIKAMLARARTTSRRHGGFVGPWIFYAAAYGALYYAYLVVEIRGPGALLAHSLR